MKPTLTLLKNVSENNMFLELREIEVGENWFNKNSENIVVVDLEEHGVNAYVEDLQNYPDCLDKYMFVGLGYNTDDWRNSAVDRDLEVY